jgi:Putative addiction module component
MLTLDQLISEATALSDSDKAILIDKIVESMTGQIDQDILIEEVKKAQERIAKVDSGAIQPGTLTGLRGIAKRAGAAPNDDDLQAEYTDYLTQKYQ